METYERKIQGGCIDDKENYGQIRKKKQPDPGEFYVGKQERREEKKNRENIWNRSGNQSRKNRRTPMTRKSRT